MPSQFSSFAVSTDVHTVCGFQRIDLFISNGIHLLFHFIQWSVRLQDRYFLSMKRHGKLVDLSAILICLRVIEPFVKWRWSSLLPAPGFKLTASCIIDPSDALGDSS